MVEAKMFDWFDYRSWYQYFSTVRQLADVWGLEFRLYRWLRANTLDPLTLGHSKRTGSKSDQPEVWKERKEAENAIRDYLADMPSVYTR